MQRWNIISATLVLALFAAGVLMVFQIIGQTSQTTAYNEKLQDINPENISMLISELRSIEEKSSSRQNRRVLFLLMLQESLYFPEDAVRPLKEVFEIGEKAYWEDEFARDWIGTELAFAYLYAGLPAQLDSWQAQVVTYEPHTKYRVHFLQAVGKLLADDLLAARQIIDKELEIGANTTRGKGFALLCYLMLEDFDAVEKIELDETIIEAFDLSQQVAYAELLMMNGEYRQSADFIANIIMQADSKPEHHLRIAVPMAALSGINHPDVQVQLQVATVSTRRPMSIHGAKAIALSELMRFGVTGTWRNELEQLAIDHPTDFWVQAALLESRLMAVKKAVTASTDSATSLAVPKAIEPLPVLLSLAQTEHERQWANLLLSTLFAYQYHLNQSLYPQGLEDALIHLKCALGDTQVDGFVDSDRIPDYEVLVLDPIINNLRTTNLAFNSDVNHAITDYLRRVQSRYQGVVDEKPLEYRVP